MNKKQQKNKMGILHIEPHVIEPYAFGNNIVNDKYLVQKQVSQGLYATETRVDYTNKKGDLIEGYVLCIKWHTTSGKLPNTSELLNMPIYLVEQWCEPEIEEIDHAFVNNMARPVLNRKIKEANRIHKTKLKCIVNPLLRKIQYWTDEPYVIASNFNNGEFITYKITKVKYKKNPVPLRRDTYEIKVHNPFFKTIKHILGVKNARTN